MRSIQAKETQLRKQQITIEMMQKKIDEISMEREKFIRKENEMTTDIEKLIRHNDVSFSIEVLNKFEITFNTKII